MRKIQKLNSISSRCIVLTGTEGARGVDFKFAEPSFVVVAFDVVLWCDLVQAVNRGCRKIGITNTGGAKVLLSKAHCDEYFKNLVKPDELFE